jgi:CheY-like chemotaxis protein
MNPAPHVQARASPATVAMAIVVADDVAEITALARQWLQDAGHTVTCAASGDEVIRLMKRQHIDVAVVDVLMPDGDGLDVVLAARRISPKTRVLAISGGGRYMTADECLRIASGVGADRILFKPFTRAELITAVEQLAAGRP